jgi:hypothetical protein
MKPQSVGSNVKKTKRKKLKYKILTKSKKFYWTANSVFYSIMLVTTLPVFIKLNILKSENVTTFDKSLLSIMLFGFVGTIIYGISKYNKFVTLKGELNTDLEFKNDRIIINEKEYLINFIQKIELNACDYKGAYSGFRNFDGTLSNGVDNTLKIYLNDNDKIEINFQQNLENELRNEKDILLNYCNNGKLHYLNLLDILGINNYEEIQKFKSENLTKSN